MLRIFPSNNKKISLSGGQLDHDASVGSSKNRLINAQVSLLHSCLFFYTHIKKSTSMICISRRWPCDTHYINTLLHTHSGILTLSMKWTKWSQLNNNFIIHITDKWKLKFRHFQTGSCLQFLLEVKSEKVSKLRFTINGFI